ncbi:putative ankyrin repeat protein RF_0381 [Microplitis mediator]|uniref:putative ankyrin repeat protein RF_0381 n=1 Tax=Microplitis mediator TaxID=375433 RepID=UPI002554BCD8|nr:putative ankyrin repeat protein RF_0381 [Microplitis mediator]
MSCEPDELMSALEKSDAATIKTIVSNLPDPNAPVYFGETLLYLVTHKGNLDLIRHLVGYVDLNAQGFSGPALHESIVQGQLDVTSFLIQNGADINKASTYMYQDGFSPLHTAILSSNKPATELLLKMNADVNARDSSMNTPLHIASQTGNYHAAALLLSHGASMAAINSYNETPFCDATDTGNLNILKLFLTNGIHKNDPQLLNHSLKRAIDTKNASVVQFMIDNGADVNFVFPYKFTPLHFAANADEIKTIEILLQNSANVLARSESNSLPIFYADHRKNSAMVDLLLDRHSEIDLEHGKELIYEAVMNDCPLVVEKLLTHRIYNLNVDELTASGVRLLDAAVLNKKESSVDALLKCGASSELRTQGVTTIDLAIRCKNYYFIYSWLEYGGNFYNYRANQPLYLSRLEKIIEMIDCYEYGVFVMDRGLRKHLILMKSAGLFTYSRYDEFTDPYGTREKAMIEWECEQELERAKKTYVGGVSCWDLLAMEDRRLMTWSRKPEVKTIMEEGKFEIPFRYCDRWLMSCYRRGVRRPGLVNKFGECFGEIFSDLGFDEVEKVLIYLTNDDIGNLISVCEGQ